ncbi:MAG TPA: DUF3570 domain-containing protein [Steroidobacteraceae bacterium]|nr:DUF3570 domain-containing protein [Steroidobacteraceae bacterium]
MQLRPSAFTAPHPRARRAATTVARLALLVLLVAGLYSAPTRTAVLPEDEVDYSTSQYVGGGQVIDGKTWLLRKSIGDKVSVEYSHLTDVVSGASIDVMLYASPYVEQRTQDSLNLEYLSGKTTYSVGFTHSYEPDYRSNTANFSISEDMFGDLTTVTMSFRRTWNDVYKMECAMHSASGECEDKIHDPDFGEKTMDERSYAVGLTQILTRNSILSVNDEIITDMGWLSNPYRDIIYLDPTSGRGFSTGPETDPSTRTSNAIGGDYKYYLPYRAAIDAQYRYYFDTWGIHASTAQLGYTQPWRKWIFDVTGRYYTQTHASFYNNAFAYADEQNFESRNRELSTYHSHSVGAGATYEFKIPHVSWIQKSTANIRYDRIWIDYEDFNDALLVNTGNGITIENAPLYSVDLRIYQFFISLWF